MTIGRVARYCGLAALTMLTVPVTWWGQGNSGQQSNEGPVRLAVVNQVRSEFALYNRRADYGLAQESVTLEKGPVVSSRLRIARAFIPSDHSHPYLVGLVGDTVIRLGGFTDPQLFYAAKVLRPDSLGPGTLRVLAERLAVLADMYGSFQYVFPGHEQPVSDASRIIAAWTRKAPPSWPIDTVISRVPAGWGVRLTIISRNARSMTPYWSAIAYAFEFDGEGVLLSWSRRIGDGFGVPRVKLSPTVEPW